MLASSVRRLDIHSTNFFCNCRGVYILIMIHVNTSFKYRGGIEERERQRKEEK